MRFLLKLYPQAWRERYEEEMLAVLMEHKITPATVVDLLIGAFDAHLNDNGFAKGARFMRNQLRSGLINILIGVYAPQLFNTQDVGSPMFITGLIGMAIGTLVASMGLKRGKLIRIN